MKKNMKISVFFFGLCAVILGAVFVYATAIYLPQSINSLLDRQDVYNYAEQGYIKQDLIMFGHTDFNIERPYSEFVDISSEMEQNCAQATCIMDWTEIKDYIHAGEVEENLLAGCNWVKPGMCWNDMSYDNCANSCTGGYNACVVCCDTAGSAGDYNNEEVRWCRRWCSEKNKVKPGRSTTTAYSVNSASVK